MRRFEYGDDEISSTELLFSVASMILGLGVLTLPRGVAKVVPSSDGWIAILIAGLLAMMFTWVLSRLAIRFPRQPFTEFAPRIVGRPLAVVLSVFFFIAFAMFSSYEVRGAAEVAKEYLFTRTPVEVIGLIFFLVVIYAASGPRIGIVRLNLLFLPFVIVVFVMVLVMNAGFFEFEQLKPIGISDWRKMGEGIQESLFSFLGFESVVFYAALMNRPQETVKAAVIGISIPLILYTALFIVTIGVFSAEATAELQYPAVELAKEIEVPGAILERFESIFFTIWLMTIFNSAAMTLDICIWIAGTFFRRSSKRTIAFALAPIIYLAGYLPKDLTQLAVYGQWFSYIDLFAGILIPSLLLVIAKLRGVSGHA
ncbi:GerAB/ArcD/ProY family transporter [Paenibacillus ehimensis]|uniref:GerAB/ArcD/ProY family transporter n=1 Tax=Paenibacillus ehimensis TaxID=79264 RepID=UPI00047212AD|nr:GerAB/ArcD/ProY family transporter [Paenibacillus ehimensis]MEC0209334.1 GerAB/ArcD/ProY family transporter [Paenibacillus ehimensis]